MFLLLFALIPSFASANPWHIGTLSSLNLGIRYSSVLTNRGVILYRDFQIDPVLGVFFFDDKLEFLGDSIGYRDFIYKDKVRLRSRIVSITDKPLFPDHSSIKRHIRKDSYEWSNRVETFFPGYNESYKAELDFEVAKDFYSHKGIYLEAQSKFKLINLSLLNTNIEPNLFGSIGWGDSKHNKHFYGQSASENGFNNISYGLRFAFPGEADRFYPIIQLTRFEIIGDKNRFAEYSFGNNKGWLFSVIATYGLLE